MVSLPSSLRRLIQELAGIPSIGPRQATRLAFYLAAEGQKTAGALAGALSDLRNIKICGRCFFVFEPDSADANERTLCEFCSNPSRDQSTVMIVEKETDLISLENTGRFRGRYLILGDMPKTGLLEPWQKERLDSLKKFLAAEFEDKASEIILALDPTSLGDFHASILSKELGEFAEKLTRLGRGLPAGGEIEFADDETLGSAFEGRS